MRAVKKGIDTEAELATAKETLKNGWRLIKNQEFEAAAQELTMGYYLAARTLDRDLLGEYNKAIQSNIKAYKSKRGPRSEAHKRDDQLCFIVSYPRSGNTFTITTLKQMLPSRIYGAMSTPYNCYFDRDFYYVPPGELALIKDHVYHEDYKSDRTLYVIRDGRDSILSFAYMTYKTNQHKYYRHGELADYIRFNKKSCPFGDWASNVRNALSFKNQGAEVKFMHYDAIVNQVNGLLEVASFFAPHLEVPEAKAQKAVEIATKRKENLKRNPSWGYDDVVPPESYFHEWSQNRGASNWASAFDSAAKRAFHETGATELLLEFGFESDPDWWRD